VVAQAPLVSCTSSAPALRPAPAEAMRRNARLGGAAAPGARDPECHWDSLGSCASARSPAPDCGRHPSQSRRADSVRASPPHERILGGWQFQAPRRGTQGARPTHASAQTRGMPGRRSGRALAGVERGSMSTMRYSNSRTI
jgi:hypothetical protein